MRTVQATEAKARLAEILRTVEHGETVTITRHGQAIARLVPAPAEEQAGREQAVARFRRRRNEWQSVDISIDEILRVRHHGHRL